MNGGLEVRAVAEVLAERCCSASACAQEWWLVGKNVTLQRSEEWLVVGSLI